MVGRLGVAEYLPLRVESIPAQRRDGGVLAEFANVVFDALPCRDTAPRYASIIAAK
jgi:hypothetical protein